MKTDYITPKERLNFETLSNIQAKFYLREKELKRMRSQARWFCFGLTLFLAASFVYQIFTQ